MDRLSADDFVEDQRTDFWTDRKSLSWGIKAECMPLVHFRDVEKYIYPPDNVPNPWPDYILNFRSNQSSIKANNYVTIYYIYIATLDKFVVERAMHDVESHDRLLSSGRHIKVCQHTRRNPRYIRGRRTLTEDMAHIVYMASDSDGKIRYFGEGVRNRPSHVNSGVSHNYKINEHFFKAGHMSVEILREGPTKNEALAIERLLIKRHSGSALWNIKEYEPEVDKGQDATPVGPG